MNKNSLIEIASFTPRSLNFPNSWIGHLPFAAWIIRETSPKIFVELGTHTGNSYFSFCQSVAENHLPTKCYAVDTWQGDEHSGLYGEEVFGKVEDLNNRYYSKFSVLMRMTFDDAVSYFNDESIDLLHIDGLHTYEAVCHDFENWLPKLAPGAVVMFHDTNVRERAFGVWKLWEELKNRYPFSIEFTHSHGLGVLQLDNASDDQKLNWLQPNSAEKQQINRYYSALGSHQLQSYELRELKKQNTEIIRTIAERDSQITILNQKIIERDDQIFHLSASIAEYDEQISNFNQQIAERDAQIDNLNQTMAEQDGLISDLNQTIAEYIDSNSWKITAPIRMFSQLCRRGKNFFVRLIGTKNKTT